MTVDEIKNLIVAERARQDALHPADWREWAPTAILCILIEEVGEVAQAVNDRTGNGVRQELVEVAAVCFRWLEVLVGDSVRAWEYVEHTEILNDRCLEQPTERVSSLRRCLSAFDSPHNGTVQVLSAFVGFCVRWLLWFEDDPTLCEEKRRIQSRKVSEA